MQIAGARFVLTGVIIDLMRFLHDLQLHGNDMGCSHVTTAGLHQHATDRTAVSPRSSCMLS